ncbi:MAG: class IV adenylate cyclase [Gemmatimonadales bacterium]
MADELELKAVVPDPEALRGQLRASGGRVRFRGRMSDRRFDRAGELAAGDEVLRVRSYRHTDGHTETILGWKGPVRLSPDGYKQREELELPIAGASVAPQAFLAALGYDVVHAIDREVEIYDVGGATVRLEHYPDMDPLLEVEGAPAAIEGAIELTGIRREAFTADSLADFVRRFEARTGRPAVLAAS